MIEIVQKAHLKCDKCNAVISYDSEDIQVDEDEHVEYTQYSRITHIEETHYIVCPVCKEKHIIRIEKK